MTDEEFMRVTQAAAKLLAKDILEHLECPPESLSSLTIERLDDAGVFQLRAEYAPPMALRYFQLQFPMPPILPLLGGCS